MQAVTQSGISLLRSAIRRSVFLYFFLGVFSLGAATLAFAEAALTVKLKLPKLPAKVKVVSVSVTALEAETAAILGTVYLEKKSSQVQLDVQATPLIVFADILTSQGSALDANSHVLWPVDGKKLSVTLQLKSQASDSLELPDLIPTFGDFGGASWPPLNRRLVGLPNEDFKLEGIQDESARLTARESLRSRLAKSPCYNIDGGFVMIEVDPGVLAMRKSEIDLSNSASGDPSTRIQDLRVPPNQFFHGTVSSDGTNVTVTYTLVGPGGYVLKTKSGTGPIDDIDDIIDEVAQEMADAMCSC
jgi:hypothetical protein